MIFKGTFGYLKEITIIYCCSIIMIFLFSVIGYFIKPIGDVLYFIVALIFILFPIIIARIERLHLNHFGLNEERIGGDIVTGLFAAVVIFPPFTLGAYIYWKYILKLTLDFHLTFPPNLLNMIMVNIFLVAFPEEFFYRGYLQTRIGEFFKQRGVKGWRKILLPVLISSVLFSLGHIITIPAVTRLSVFFPSLIFGLLKEWRGTIFTSTIFHAFCNIFMDTLLLSYGLITLREFT